MTPANENRPLEIERKFVPVRVPEATFKVTLLMALPASLPPVVPSAMTSLATAKIRLKCSFWADLSAPPSITTSAPSLTRRSAAGSKVVRLGMVCTGGRANLKVLSLRPSFMPAGRFSRPSPRIIVRMPALPKTPCRYFYYNMER